MVEELIVNKIGTIENVFGEERKIIPKTLDKISEGEGDVFKTEDGGIIYLEALFDDFTVEELVRFTGIAETLYSKYDSHCTCYILCMGKVLVTEMPITSQAEFTIKLAQSQISPCEIVLNSIKSKFNQGELLDEDDIKALQMLPLMCSPDEKSYYRRIVFSILTEIGL